MKLADGCNSKNNSNRDFDKAKEMVGRKKGKVGMATRGGWEKMPLEDALKVSQCYWASCCQSPRSQCK